MVKIQWALVSAAHLDLHLHNIDMSCHLYHYVGLQWQQTDFCFKAVFAMSLSFCHALGPLSCPCITASEVFWVCSTSFSNSIFLQLLSSLMGALFAHLNRHQPAADAVVVHETQVLHSSIIVCTELCFWHARACTACLMALWNLFSSSCVLAVPTVGSWKPR